MANLLSTVTGRETLSRVACYLGRRRMSRALKRGWYRAFYDWRLTGHFSFETLLGELNPTTQDEIEQINNLLGELGCLESSTSSDMTVYIDPVSGSDLVGDGSSSNPYASFSFLDTFPKYINHNVRFLIVNDVTTTDPIVFDQTIGPNGSISIIGVGTPTVVTTGAGTGPFVVTSSTTYGSGPSAINLGVADTFVADELYGKWVQMTTGLSAGQILPVHHNTANNVWTRFGWENTPAISDRFQIVEPARTLTAPVIDLAVRGPSDLLSSGSRASRFNIVNLKLDIRTTAIDANNFVLRNEVETQLSFVTLISDSTMFNFCRLQSDLNQHKAVDTDIITLSGSSITNLDGPISTGTCCGLNLYRTTFPTFSYDEMIIENTKRVSAINMRGRCAINGHIGVLSRSGFGAIRGDLGSACLFALNVVYGNSAGGSIDIQEGACWEVDTTHFIGGQDAFYVYMGDIRIVASNITISGTFSAFGIRFDRGQARVVFNSDPSAITGTTGDIHFAGGVGTTAHPAADARAQDLLGNYVARIETL